MITGGVSIRENKYEISEKIMNAGKRWEQDNMYKTSYYKQSEKNVKIVNVLEMQILKFILNKNFTLYIFNVKIC
jgi:hypothetical protein